MDGIDVGHGVHIPEAELTERASRSGGPGGQHVNTTASKVELRWSVADSPSLSETQRARLAERLASRLTADGVLILTASEHRSQHRNREAVRARMATLVSQALAEPTRRRPTRPSRAAKRRRLQAKRHRGEQKRLRRPPPAE